jgi:hypothetical protein
MPLPQLILLAVVAMAGLGTLRVVRFRAGRTPLPDSRGRRLFMAAFVVVPPIVVGGIGALPMYVAIIAVLAIVMWIAAQVVGMVANGRTSRLIQIALAGREEDRYAARADAAVTTELAESVRIVDRANKAFPRGVTFPAQVTRAGFQDDWELLDRATRSLEDRIADDRRRGLAVASGATAAADDARSRLDTLRRLAGDQGQAWAAA